MIDARARWRTPQIAFLVCAGVPAIGHAGILRTAAHTTAFLYVAEAGTSTVLIYDAYARNNGPVGQITQ